MANSEYTQEEREISKGNPHNYEAGFTIENHRDELIERLGKAIKRINELESEAAANREGNRKRVARHRAKNSRNRTPADKIDPNDR